ncbi:MAG: filamentous hemagglutinin N-terminal domain-containing protein, partial [Proteobacteria bacterium]|nr:filamentous hemagglutinin N-terminal domain-containing protein [Pseudomonadota bacterium]
MSHVTTRNLKLTHCLRRLLYRRNAALALMAPGLAFAGPSGEVVVGGEADIVRPDANNTVINQFTHRAAINWQTFSVDADEYVIFNQPDASSIMLNRVIGGDASYILGHLQSNGQVFLLNPHGVYFTHGASLDVQGFLASTLDMNPNDFMAGDFTLTRSDSAPATGRVINDGEITAGPGGYVVLAGDYTENTGIITANAGTVALVSGNTLTLDIEGDGLVSFAIDEATLSDAAGVRNAGSLIADGGMVVMTAQVANNLTATAVNNEGLVRAHSVEQRDGEIWLVGHGGDVTNSGTLDADGENADGGKIIMYSDRNITLSDSAVQTAAGDENHSGGFMRFVAEDHLDYQGDNLIRATGGMSGGFVEVSGHGTLNILGVPQLGPGGRLMIDPSIVALRNGTAAPFGSSAFSPVFGPCTDAICSGSATILTTGWIATQLGSGVDVTLVASNTILLDETLVPVNLVATGSGDLTMTIGTVSAPNGATGFGLPPGGTTSQDEGAWTGGPPTVTSMSGGDIKLAGLNISIAGNFSANADQGQIALGEISANNVAVDAGSLGSANVIGGGFNGIAATGNVTITGNVVNVSYFETGNNVTVNGNFSGSNLYVGSSLATTAV